MADPHARNTTRHREAAAASRAETRRRLLQAAGEEFAERGYHSATVSRIAKRAGVTVQTLYLAWGSKRALLRGHMEATLAGSPDTAYVDALPGMIDDALAPTGADAIETVRHIAHLYRVLAERAAPLWKLYRDAAATDPVISADWQALQHARRKTFAQMIRRIDASALRPHISVAAAADTAWAIASPETYDLLVRTAEYSLDDYERWVSTTLIAVLLA